MQTLGTRLKAEREKRGWTQEVLARKAGIGDTTIADIETGRTRATTKLVDIAKALRVNPQWLQTGNGPKEPVPTPENTYIAAESLEDLADKLLNKGTADIVRLWQLILERQGNQHP